MCEAAQATMLRWLVTPLFSMARLVLVTRPSTTATHMVATLLGLVMLCRVVSCPVRIYYQDRSKHVTDIVPTTREEWELSSPMVRC